MRRKTQKVFYGNVPVGGDAPIMVQSMTDTDTKDVEATLKQIRELSQVGCEVVRIAVPNNGAVSALPAIIKNSPMPVVADIHFDYRLALGALDSGVAGLRINPGNIGKREHVQAIIERAKENKVPIRIGINSGSLPEDKIKKAGGPNSQALVETAREYIEIFQTHGFTDLVLSLKSTNILETIEANRIIARENSYPLHLGITEAGTFRRGIVRSISGLSPLLLEGLGDTIRISLTENPVEEVRVAWDLLNALEIRTRGVNIFSCPTCGRCEIDVKEIVEELDRKTCHIEEPVNIAVMGCVVNGPGEAREAHLGIAGGKNKGALFKKGEIIGTYSSKELPQALLKALQEYILDRK